MQVQLEKPVPIAFCALGVSHIHTPPPVQNGQKKTSNHCVWNVLPHLFHSRAHTLNLHSLGDTPREHDPRDIDCLLLVFFVLEVTFFLLKYFLSESVWYTDGTGLFLSWGPVIITYSMFRYSIFLFWQFFWIYCSHDDK